MVLQQKDVDATPRKCWGARVAGGASIKGGKMSATGRDGAAPAPWKRTECGLRGRCSCLRRDFYSQMQELHLSSLTGLSTPQLG
jgi:hypothetical protein